MVLRFRFMLGMSGMRTPGLRMPRRPPLLGQRRSRKDLTAGASRFSCQAVHTGHLQPHMHFILTLKRHLERIYLMHGLIFLLLYSLLYASL